MYIESLQFCNNNDGYSTTSVLLGYSMCIGINHHFIDQALYVDLYSLLN